MIRIFIVDDSVAIRGSLYSLLGHQPDFEVVGSAGDGREALEMALELHPDVVIMDGQMPNIDGLEAIKRIKEDSASIGILFFSVYADYIEKSITAGADGHLVKDCEVWELFSEVRRIAAQYQQLPA